MFTAWVRQQRLFDRSRAGEGAEKFPGKFPETFREKLSWGVLVLCSDFPPNLRYLHFAERQNHGKNVYFQQS